MLATPENFEQSAAAATPRAWTPRWLLLANLCLATLYVVSGVWGLGLSGANERVTLVWIPSGISLAALLLVGPWLLPGVAAGAIAVFLINIQFQNPWTSLLVGAGNSLEALAGWWLLRRLMRFDCSMSRLNDAAGLVFVAAPLAPLVAAGCGAAALCLGGLHTWAVFWDVAAKWYVGDAMSILVIAPVVITWLERPRRYVGNWKEAAVVIALVLIAAASVFIQVGKFRQSGFPVAFLLLPLVVWGATRMSPRGASLLSLLLTVAAGLSTLSHRNTQDPATFSESLRLFWAFVGVVSGTAVCLAAAAEENRRIQTDLIRKSDRYSLMLDGSGQIGWEIDSNSFTFTYVGARPGALLGYSLDDWQLPNFLVNTLFPADREPTLSAFRANVASGESHTLEFRMIAADGSVVWMQSVASVIRRDGMTLVTGIMTNVTERKLSQERVEAAERKFRALFEKSPYGVMIIDSSNGCIVEVNATLGEMLGGYPPADLIGVSVSDLDTSRSPEALNRKFEELRREGSSAFESRWRTRSGEIIDVVLGVRTTTIAGRPLFHCVVHDITQQKADATALIENEQRFRDMFERHNSVMLLVDKDLRVITEANDAAAAFYGYTRDELRGLSVSAINHSAVAQIDVAIQKAVRGERNRFEFTHHLKNGEARTVEIHSSPIQHQGRVLLFSIIHDITERRRIEHERDILQQQILHAQKLESLGVMAGGVAHDFNNLLVGILGNAGLARAGLEPSTPAHMILTRIEQAAQRAAELTRQLLAYAGKSRFQIEVVDLSELVLEMTHLLEISLPAKARISLDIAAGLSPIEIDATQVRQVTMNLLTNAADALNGQPGEISVRTGTMAASTEYLSSRYVPSDAPPGEYVFLEIADNGAGMDRATMQRIFDPFFTTKFTGRGLGLAATLGVVRGHRGAIKVNSEPGKGTTFRVLFPVPAHPVALPAIEVKLTRASEDSPEVSAAGATILVVDDERFVREFATSSLRTRGYQVVNAADGEEALVHLREMGSSVSAIFLDLTMPGLSGYELLWTIREMGVSSPVVLTSGYAEEEVLEKLHETSGVSFLQKPYTHDALLEAIDEAVATWNASRPARTNPPDAS